MKKYVFASTKLLIFVILYLFTNSVNADERISILKIVGKVQISSDMKNWVIVKKPQKIEKMRAITKQSPRRARLACTRFAATPG